MKDAVDAYKGLQKLLAKRGLASVEAAKQINAVYAASVKALQKTTSRIDLRSLVSGKKYFALSAGKKASRAVNDALFAESDSTDLFLDALEDGDPKKFETALRKLGPDKINVAVYTVAMSFFCVIDLLKEGDQKTPGTFFEYLVGHLFARLLGVSPAKRVAVLNLDMEGTLPTDFIFDLGVDQPKFHVPVKTSTRERVIQVWAHQRVLDGVYGVGRFIGTPVIAGETKTDKEKREVIEICLPDQWRIYQAHIAQLRRIYYLDVPIAYKGLNDVFPRIAVKPGEFFFETKALISAV